MDEFMYSELEYRNALSRILRYSILVSSWSTVTSTDARAVHNRMGTGSARNDSVRIQRDVNAGLSLEFGASAYLRICTIYSRYSCSI